MDPVIIALDLVKGRRYQVVLPDGQKEIFLTLVGAENWLKVWKLRKAKGEV